MDVSHFETRRRKILEFIIQTYVETAAPVGSEAVCRRFHLRVSPATVRNVMGELEEQAFLTHPHTSAGRVPTTRGYRYYVDLLMSPEVLAEEDVQAIQALKSQPGDDPLDLLHTACRVIADVSGQVSAVLAPRMTQSVLRRIDLIPVNPRRVLGLLMTTEGLLKHTFLELQEAVDADELDRISRFLNEELEGQVLSTVEERLQQALTDASNAFNYLYKRAQELWTLGGFIESGETVFVEGSSRLLAQPEFRDAHRSRPMLEALESQGPIVTVLKETMAQGQPRTTIGSEHTVPALRECSVVSAPYRVGSRVAGALGVIGPTRMEYARMVSVVGQMAEAVSRAMERFVGR